jgi:putative membrane protein
MASIYYTQSLAEMTLWAMITGATQFIMFIILRKFYKSIESNYTAPAIFIAAISIALGLLNAVSITH